MRFRRNLIVNSISNFIYKETKLFVNLDVYKTSIIEYLDLKMLIVCYIAYSSKRGRRRSKKRKEKKKK
jgi:hypothetical protein